MSCFLILTLSSRKKSEVKKSSHDDAAILEVILESKDGDVIDPTISFIKKKEDLFVQLDGLVDSAEILGLDDIENKSEDELKDLDEFFEILSQLDGEWLLLKNTDETEQILNYFILNSREISSISSSYLPEEYLSYSDFANDYDMEKFTEMFYNIVNERFIEE